MALALCLQAGEARAADAADSADHRYQTWLAGFAHGAIGRDLWLWSDVHLRLHDSFEPAAVLVRPGLSWRARPSLFVTAGYGWTPSFSQASAPRTWGEIDFTDEHRAWQQLLWAPFDERTGASAQVRARFEQRFRPADGAGTGLRLRLLARGQIPITHGLDAGRDWFFVIWDETFVALDDADWGQTRGLDQNRLFVGVGWQVRPTFVRLELGYTNQWLPRPGRDPTNHILALNTFFGWR